MRRRFWIVPRAVAIAIACLVALGVITLVILTALGAFPGTSGGAVSAQRSGVYRTYYVSLGDSYAVGFQPSPTAGATPGYTAVVAAATRMKLVNFGCGGATTSSILHTAGCKPPTFGPQASQGAVTYPDQTQAAAATAFLRRHRGHVGLVTVSIGGNDVTDCAGAADPTSCVIGALPKIKSNVTTLARDLRRAAGKKVPIIGLTYPDVLLGLWVYPPGHTNTSLATLSVAAFKSLINPALSRAYHSAHATFVDITGDMGAYVPLTKTAPYPPYGTVPVAVARVCSLTWYCTQGNIHATTAGYRLIGRDIVRVLKVVAH